MRDIEPGERERLESLAVEPDAVARRAKIVLALGSSGLPVAAVARLFGVSAATVRHWRDRFAANGADGLADRPRSGAPRVIGKKARASIASLVGKGMSSREIAQRLGISKASVVAKRAEQGVASVTSGAGGAFLWTEQAVALLGSASDAKVAQQLRSGEYEARTFYVLGDAASLALARASMDPVLDRLERFDNRWVLAPGWQRQPAANSVLR